jgi:hypothetical protein
VITISPTTDDFRAAADRLALRVAELVRERDIAIGEAQDAVATAQQLKDERDRARTETAEALRAGLDLQLQAASAKRFAARAWAAAEDIAATVTDVVCENERLRARVAELEALRAVVVDLAPGRHRFRRGR